MTQDSVKITLLETGTTSMMQPQAPNQNKCKNISKKLKREHIMNSKYLMMIQFTWTNIMKSSKKKTKKKPREVI